MHPWTALHMFLVYSTTSLDLNFFISCVWYFSALRKPRLRCEPHMESILLQTDRILATCVKDETRSSTHIFSIEHVTFRNIEDEFIATTATTLNQKIFKVI